MTWRFSSSSRKKPEAAAAPCPPDEAVPRPAPFLEVVCAVLLKSDGEFLLARRPEGKPYPGYWEFPGGKVEPGESAPKALARELKEELGIRVLRAYPWITQVFAYPHATVRLRFYRVVEWEGIPHGHENQTLAWQSTQQIIVSPLLPANAPVLKALSLPRVYAISNAAGLGEAAFLKRLDCALEAGIEMVQVRERDLPYPRLERLAREVVARVHSRGGIVLINSDSRLAWEVGADGVHLTAAQLMTAGERPEATWCGASCHNREELVRAAELGVDFVVLGPVKPTRSHPGARILGWEAFAELVRGYPLPVYALGGMNRADLPQAWERGAHGVAMLRSAWELAPPFEPRG